MDNQNKPMTINVEWFGTKKNGKVALLSKTDGKEQWFNIGRNFNAPPETFVKGQSYDVLVGEDQFHILYINGLDMGGEMPSPAVQEKKPEVSAPKPATIPEKTPQTPQNGVILPKTGDSRPQALLAACTLFNIRFANASEPNIKDVCEIAEAFEIWLKG